MVRHTVFLKKGAIRVQKTAVLKQVQVQLQPQVHLQPCGGLVTPHAAYSQDQVTENPSF